MRTDKIDLDERGYDVWEATPTTEEIRNHVLDGLANNVRAILEMLDGTATKEEIAEYIREFLIKPL